MGLDSKPSKRDIEMLTKPELEKGLRMRPAFEIDFMCSRGSKFYSRRLFIL